MIPSWRTAKVQRHVWEWLSFVIVVVLSGCLVVSNVITSRQLVQRAEEERLTLLAGVLADDIEADLAATNAALASVIQDYFVEPSGPDGLAQATRRMTAMVKAMRGARSVSILDKNGILIAGSRPELVGLSLRQREYFKTVMRAPSASRLYVSPPFRSVTNELVIALVRMVPDRQGQFGGVIVAMLDQHYFSAKFRSVRYVEDIWAYIVHGNGMQFVNFPHKPQSDGINLDRPGTLFRHHLDGGRVASLVSGTVYTTHEQRIMALRTIRPPSLAMDWPIVLGLSRLRAAIVEPVARQAWVTTSSFLALALVCGAVLFWVQRRRIQTGRGEAELMRRRAEMDALAHSETRFRTLIEDAPLAIAILRAGHFIYSNPRYRALHGYSAGDDLNGRPWTDMICPDPHQALTEPQRLIHADSALEQQFEVLGLGKGGSQVPILKNTTRVHLLDGPATLVFAQDISAQKQAEALTLQARDAAQAANRSKTDFLANMSHEIRSPLNAILGLAYLLERAKLAPGAREMVQKLRMSGQSLLQIVNDILDVSKIDAGHMVLEDIPFELAHVIDAVAAGMSLAAVNQHIELVIHPLPAGIVSLLGDALRLQQVLVNLTGNAIKFTREGRVELRTTVMEREGAALMLRFSVSDTGPGIAPDLREAIFSPFTQADTSTTRRYGGTGLGLTICRQLVRLMGGELTLHSELGQGSEFAFTARFTLAPAPAAVAAPPIHGITALIADDNDVALQAAGGTAHQLGWAVQAVDSGESALAYLRHCSPEQLPAVIVLDWKMPGLDGLQTARFVRECVPEHACPVVLMATAYSLADLAAQPGAEHVDAILSKPLTASSLYNATMEALRQRNPSNHLVLGADRPTSLELARMTVLVVDDSAINRDVAIGILQDHGAQTAYATDGQAALDWLLANPTVPDVVLMDVQMPGMDGIEATRRLRRLRQFDDLPIIALSAGAFSSQKDAALAAGMSQFISKPFDIAKMVATIARTGRRRAGRAGAEVAAAAPAAALDVALDLAAAVAPESAAPTEDPVIDIDHGVAMWGGVPQYVRYLRRFTDGYADVTPRLRAYLDRGDTHEAAKLAHQLAGVAASLAMPEVYKQALELERALARGVGAHDDRVRSLDAVLVMVRTAIAAFETSAGADAAPAPAQGVDCERLLGEFLQALDLDAPGPAEALLGMMAGCMSAREHDELARMLADFDFRGAERFTKNLSGK